MVASKTVVLNRTHLRKFAEALELKASEVLNRMDSGASRHDGSAGRPSDDADWAEQAHQEWVASSRDHLDHVLLFQIKDALNRVENGEFGECQSCGETISMKRLKALPWARYCIECQSRVGDEE
jgi:DnaK suppressor protein